MIQDLTPDKVLSRTGRSGMTISNYHNVCPLSCIMNTLHSQNKFFKETTYTKVHFYLKDLRGLNKPGTPKGINK